MRLAIAASDELFRVTNQMTAAMQLKIKKAYDFYFTPQCHKPVHVNCTGHTPKNVVVADHADEHNYNKIFTIIITLHYYSSYQTNVEINHYATQSNEFNFYLTMTYFPFNILIDGTIQFPHQYPPEIPFRISSSYLTQMSDIIIEKSMIKLLELIGQGEYLPYTL